jgi:hypothetical protein
MDENRNAPRAWQVSVAGLVVGAAVVAAILALWQPWVKLPPVGEVRGNIDEADVKHIQKLTAGLTKDPIELMELLETGAIEVRIEHTLEFFTFELVGGKWTKTSSGYIATMDMPSGPPPPAREIVNYIPVDLEPVTAPVQMAPSSGDSAPTSRRLAPPPPPNMLPADHATVVDTIQYFDVAPAGAVAPAAEIPGPEMGVPKGLKRLRAPSAALAAEAALGPGEAAPAPPAPPPHIP